jgi:hypothetical protein
MNFEDLRIFGGEKKYPSISIVSYDEMKDMYFNATIIVYLKEHIWLEMEFRFSGCEDQFVIVSPRQENGNEYYDWESFGLSNNAVTNHQREVVFICYGYDISYEDMYWYFTNKKFFARLMKIFPLLNWCDNLDCLFQFYVLLGCKYRTFEEWCDEQVKIDKTNRALDRIRNIELCEKSSIHQVKDNSLKKQLLKYMLRIVEDCFSKGVDSRELKTIPNPNQEDELFIYRTCGRMAIIENTRSEVDCELLHAVECTFMMNMKNQHGQNMIFECELSFLQKFEYLSEDEEEGGPAKLTITANYETSFITADPTKTIQICGQAKHKTIEWQNFEEEMKILGLELPSTWTCNILVHKMLEKLQHLVPTYDVLRSRLSTQQDIRKLVDYAGGR